MQRTQAISVLAQTLGSSGLRFAVEPKQREALGADCFLEYPSDKEAGFQALSVTADSEGMLSASRRKIKFYYKPPTGRFKVCLPGEHTLHGVVQTGQFDDACFCLHLEAEDRVFGFGAATGDLEKGEAEFRLLNIDTLLFTIPKSSYSSFPFFWILRRGQAIGVLLNSSYSFEVAIGKSERDGQPDRVVSMQPICESPIGFDVIFLQGSPSEVLERYASLTGRPFLPPIWSLGLHQSRWSYKTAEKVYQIAQTYRELELPADAIHLDIHYMDRYRVFTWNRSNFPDPAHLHEKLQKLHFRSVAIVDPGVAVAEDYGVYRDGLEKRVFCRTSRGDYYTGRVWPGKTVFPDFSSADVRSWWANQHRTLFEAGVRGIWNDMNDPVLKMGKTYNPFEEDIEHQSGSHCKERNLYANHEAVATTEAFREFVPEERPFILTRSACCGIQKYAALWTGDNQANWRHLRTNLTDVMNLGLSGVPFCGADVGGFAGDLPLPGMLRAFKIRKKRELFSRWIELGSLMPFFRIHSAIFTHQQEPWSFGEEVLENCRKHIRRRYRLMPYLYTKFVESAQSGAPIVRPLFFGDPKWGSSVDKEFLESQFLLGESLLAAPVLYPKASSRRLALPPGDWYEYETGRLYSGDAIIELPIHPGYYPLFVKAGSILPVWPTLLSTEEGLNSPLSWELYIDREMSGRVILDDGISTREPGSGYTEIRIEGKKSRSGDLQLSQTILKREYEPKSKEIYLRVPEEYRLILRGGRRAKDSQKDPKASREEGRLADTLSEDRRYEMNEFALDFRDLKVELPYRSGHF